MADAPKIYITTRPRSPYWQMWWTDETTQKMVIRSTHLLIADYSRDDAVRVVNGLQTPSAGAKYTLGWLRDTTIKRLETERYPESTTAQYTRALDILITVRGEGFDLRSLKRDIVTDFKNWCLSQKTHKVKKKLFRAIGPVTINTYLQYLHAAFNSLIDQDILDTNPFWRFRKLKPRASKRRGLTIAEARAFLAALDAWPTARKKNDASLPKSVMASRREGRRLIRITLFLGLRRNEVLDIERQDVDLPNRRLYALNIKSHDKRKRWIPIPDSILEHFEYFMDKYKGDFPFRRFHPSTITHWTKDVLTSVDLGDCNLYSLRHTFATLAIEGGMPPRELQKHMDHSSFSITERYLHDKPDDKKPPNLGL